MDNLTHSVVGLGVGALIDRSVAPEPDEARARVRTRMLLTIGCLASNFPDLDLVLTHVLDAPLGYLLYHRGHTHTLLAAIGEVALLLGLVWLLWPNARRLLHASRQARRAAFGAACAGLVLHLAMDAMNVYGVHPFWPVDPSWYYGDLVFIVEPVFWIAFAVPLAAMVQSRARRWLLLAPVMLVPLAASFLGLLQWGSLAGLLLLGLLLAWIQRRMDARHGETRGHRGRLALAAGLAASLAFVGLQALALQQARAIVAAGQHALDPGERLLDTALSAFPANPLCWSFVTVAEGGGSYRLRRGLLSILPAITPAAHCPARIGGAAPADATPQLGWLSEDHEQLSMLRGLVAHNCHLQAWMRFARAPGLAEGLATDLRWGGPGVPNFSSLPYTELQSTPCPHPVPGWGMPRADLLQGP